MVGHADCAVKKLPQGISPTVGEGAVSTTCVRGVGNESIHGDAERTLNLLGENAASLDGVTPFTIASAINSPVIGASRIPLR